MPNQDDRLPQEAEPQTIKSVPGYMAQAITLSDVGNKPNRDTFSSFGNGESSTQPDLRIES